MIIDTDKSMTSKLIEKKNYHNLKKNGNKYFR